MTWDYTGASPFHGGLVFDSINDGIARLVELLPASTQGFAFQQDCATLDPSCPKSIISTDPPYYDNIGYADLSDFFYVWIRRSIQPVFPELFSTMAVPKTDELVANPFRHQTRQNAERFFFGRYDKGQCRV